MSSNTFLIDAITRHSVMLQQLYQGQSASTGRLLDGIFENIITLVEGTDLSTATPAQLDAILAEINVLSESGFSRTQSRLLDDLLKFAESEEKFYFDLLDRATSPEVTPLPSLDIQRTVLTAQMQVAPTLRLTPVAAFESFKEAKATQIKQAIKDSFTEGETSAQAAKRVRQLSKLTRSQASSLVRTVHGSTASHVAYESMRQNSDLLDGYRWLSTLDSHTSLICMRLDQQVFKFDQDAPLPPAHWSCRSVIIAVVKNKFNLLKGSKGDNRPSVGQDGAELVTTGTGYPGWLRKQPKEFIDQALGEARSQLFRDGDLTIDKFTDESGRTLTLDELENLHPLAFL